MRLPMNGNVIDMDAYKEMVDEFISNGFTYFDTAWMYHAFESENAVKKINFAGSMKKKDYKYMFN